MRDIHPEETLIKVEKTDYSLEREDVYLQQVGVTEKKGPFRFNSDNCLRIGDHIDGSFAVSIPSRKIGTIIDRSSQFIRTTLRKMPLIPTLQMANSNLIVQRGSPLNFQVSSASTIRHCFTVDAKASGCDVMREGAFFLDENIKQSFAAPDSDGEFTLTVKAEDLFGNEVEKKFVIQVDGERPVVFPDFLDFAEKKTYFDSERYIVPDGYRLSFSSKNEGFKSLVIQYCLIREKAGIKETLTVCPAEEVHIFGEGDTLRLSEGGLWRLMFRAQDLAGNEAFPGWMAYDFLVEKSCRMENLVEAFKKASPDTICTTIEDNAILPSEHLDLDVLKTVIKINGSLIVSGNENVTSLKGLDNLRSVGSIELSQNSKLSNLIGLEHLEQIAKSIKIRENPKLIDIEAFKDIAIVGGEIDITENDILSSLKGLRSLVSIGEIFYLQDNPLLSDLKGLEKLGALAEFHIVNMNIQSLAQLQKLTTINKLVISKSRSFTSLEGLQRIKRLNHLTLSNADALADLGGLRGLEVISGEMYLTSNPRLSTLEGLSALRRVQGKILQISGNVGLTSLSGLCPSEIDASVHIALSKNLKDLNALTCVHRLGKDLLLSGLGVVDLQGLSSIETIGGSLDLINLHDLERFGSDLSLSRIGSRFSATNLEKIVNFKGLERLSHVGTVIVERNPLIETFDGIQNIESADASITVKENPLLQNVDSMSAFLKNDSFIFVANPLLKSKRFENANILSAMDYEI